MARNPELEAAILARPNDVSTWAVYGDWLQVQGEPRGELVAVQHGLASTSDPNRFLELKQTEQRLVVAATADVLSAAGESAPHLKLKWRHGFVSDVELTDSPDRDGAGDLRRLLAHPAAAFVRALRLIGPRPETVAMLVDAKLPLLERLAVVGPADLLPLGAAYPGLQHFSHVVGPPGPDPVHATTPAVLRAWTGLRTLELSEVLVTDELRAVIRAAPWPALRKLSLRLPDLDGDDLEAALSLAQLRQVGLSAYSQGAVATLARLPALARLTDLELFDHTWDETLAPLLQRLGELRALKLVVHVGEISQTTVRRLRAALKGVALDHVRVFAENPDPGVITMTANEARWWREGEAKRAAASDYNHDDWN